MHFPVIFNDKFSCSTSVICTHSRIGWSFLILVLSSGLLFSCGQSPEENDAESTVFVAATPLNQIQLTAGQNERLGIEVGKIEQRSLSHTIRVNGFLDVPPQNMVSVSSPMGGFLKRTHLLPGTKVKKGQVIAIMEHPDFIQLQQEYLDSKAQLELARLEYERQKELSRENVNSAKVLQQATTAYQMLQNRERSLAEKLSLIGINAARLTPNAISRTISISSPMNGYVKSVHANLGKFVSPSDVLFEIVNTEHMHLALAVFEKDISLVREGQTVRFSLPNQVGEERTGKVHLVGKVVDADKTVPIHVHIDQDDPSLALGMYVNARIEAGDSTANVLPNAALVNEGGKDYIFVRSENEGGQYRQVEVQKGASQKGYTSVRVPDWVKPLSTQVVVKGAHALMGSLASRQEAE